MIDSFAFTQAVLDTLKGHIAVLDQAGTIMAVNEAWRRFGQKNGLQTPDACLGVNYVAVCDQVVSEDDAVAHLVAAAIRGALAGHKDGARLEYSCHSPQKQRWFTVQISPVQINDQRYVVICHQNITRRKRAEIKLQESHTRFRHVYQNTAAQLQYQSILLQNVSDAIVATDQQFKVTHWNQAAETLYGWTAAEVLGRPVRDLLKTEYPHSTEEQVYQEFVTHGLWKGDVIQIRKDGVKRSIMSSVSAFKDEAGQLMGVVAANRDITEQKVAENALRQSEERFAKAFHFNPAALILTSLMDGRILDVNEAYTQLLGYQRAEVVGRSGLELNIITNPEERAEVTRRLRETGSVRNYETVVYHRAGKKHHVLASLEPMEVNGERCILSALYDITERKEAEALLEQTMAELRRSNHDLEQFAYVASHDLQEPLRAVAGMVQLLRQRYGGQLDDRADEYISHAVDAAARMQTLINDLLTFSRVSTKGQTFAPVSGEAILQDAINSLKVAIAESGALITHDPLPTFLGDARQLTQLLQNLISNALKFRGEAVPHIHIRAEESDGEASVAVQDNGIGIAPEYFERIFVIFQRLHTRREYPGTGIGLALCKKIVERHRGRIWVTSQPGMGSTFFFTIPTSQMSLEPGKGQSDAHF
ncbi:MAG: PAS domain S-box protein [Chloroflexi bacterium]|nr:PAS domain S-box protein [Chloroflexota bacterium]